MPAPKGAKETDLPEREWEAARKIISDFDERRHDLRKYGISFVAGLLTAQSFLESGAVPRQVKLMVTLSTLALVFALRLTEADYELFQRAAVHRAERLERNPLPFSLTKDISEEYNEKMMWVFTDLTYTFLALVTGLLGLFILAPTLSLDWASGIEGLAIILTILSIWLMEAVVRDPDRARIILRYLPAKKTERDVSPAAPRT